MSHTITNRCRFSFPAIAALALTLAVPLAAAAYDTPTQGCKECVMKGVMKDGKLFRECISPNKAYPVGVCGGFCTNVDRNALRKKLKDQASAQCDATRATCLQQKAGRRHQQQLCEGAYNACRQRLNGFNDFH